MASKNLIKFHIKLKKNKKRITKKTSKKSVQRKLYFFDENANDIPEENEDEDETSQGIPVGTTSSAASMETENTSVNIINDDSGCFSSDTSLKVEETPRRIRPLVTQRTEIEGHFWDMEDSDTEKAFIAIHMKSPLSLSKESPQLVCFDRLEELPLEANMFSVQMEKGFSMRSGGMLTENGEPRKRAAPQQRINEWRKLYYKNLRL